MHKEKFKIIYKITNNNIKFSRVAILTFAIFTTFPPEDSLGLFVCYVFVGHIQDVKTAEIVFVAICSRSYHKMPVLDD